MASQDHLDLLMRSVDDWNIWRRDHWSIVPDLSEADLSWMGLRNAELSQANLCKTLLIGADLSKANLGDANLIGADLHDAFLEGADCGRATFTSANLHKTNMHSIILEAANLTAANLSQADLIRANLSRANLTNANLSRANLTDANLFSTNLSGTDLSSTILNGTKLDESNLTRANLKGAYLKDTSLNKVVLVETNMEQATFGWAIFGDADLSMTKGLDGVRHLGPSTIGIDTIYRSKGHIPEIFLRNAGVPEIFLSYMHALVSQPIEYYTCFISYSNKDLAFAERLHADLQSRGVRCWFAPEDLKIGDHYHQRVDESIRLYDKLVLVLSKHALQSAWVEREVVAAREKEDREQREVLFPIRVDDTVMTTTKAWAADVRRRWHTGDFTQWKDHDAYQQAFERLLRDLKAGEKP